MNGRSFGRFGVVERFGCQDRSATDSVTTRAGTKQHNLVAFTRSVGQANVFVLHDTHGQCVDQWVSLVDRVEDGFATNVGQAQAVAVTADSADYAVNHACRVRVVDLAKTQLVHDGNRAGTHGDDVANDTANTGGRTLVGLNVGRVVVRFDLERYSPAFTDVHNTSVFTHAYEQVLLHFVSDLLAKLAQVHLGGLV